ncbi:hypothetical protein GCM10010109_45860 [Actinoplanes campanulatus]|nr:hypothetical protein GCM10010109_45860 [Actinoplanes campanulatus]GID37921.1 hypothetical protein Aca09nite_44270 [Actinoplanes campanulatus]
MAIIKAPGVSASRPLSDLSRFRRIAPAPTLGHLTPFLAPAAAANPAPTHRDSDRGEQAMHRLRHPFASE